MPWGTQWSVHKALAGSLDLALDLGLVCCFLRGPRGSFPIFLAWPFFVFFFNCFPTLKNPLLGSMWCQIGAKMNPKSEPGWVLGGSKKRFMFHCCFLRVWRSKKCDFEKAEPLKSDGIYCVLQCFSIFHENKIFIDVGSVLAPILAPFWYLKSPKIKEK